MKILTKTLGIAALGSWGTLAQAADDVTLQLKWVTQAQFAGYYVALDKGFYGEEDLNVTIKPGGPDIAPTQVLAGGGADVTVDWMPSALAAREKGLPMGVDKRLDRRGCRKLDPGGPGDDRKRQDHQKTCQPPAMAGSW